MFRPGKSSVRKVTIPRAVSQHPWPLPLSDTDSMTTVGRGRSPYDLFHGSDADDQFASRFIRVEKGDS